METMLDPEWQSWRLACDEQPVEAADRIVARGFGMVAPSVYRVPDGLG